MRLGDLPRMIDDTITGPTPLPANHIPHDRIGSMTLSRSLAYAAISIVSFGVTAFGQNASKVAPANYDETKIKPYDLPDPLVFANGSKVDSAAEWPARRAELLASITREMFGTSPQGDVKITVNSSSEKDDSLGGLARRRLLRLHFEKDGHSHPVDVLIYTPKNAVGKVPAFMGLNFNGNHAVTNEPDVPLPTSWMRNAPAIGVTDHKATEKGRGSEASRWQAEKLMKAGYGLVTIYYGDIDPDFDDGFANGIHTLFRKPGQARTPDEGGSITAWAWGLSRVLDHLERDDRIDASRIAVIGHSRLGKTSLWAAAVDPRFALAIVNNSGCGGAAIERREFGETVERINAAFPHWFAENFRKYARNEDKLPFDAHSIIALVAPRPIYVASAAEDLWADPKGEFLGALGADPVYRLLSGEGLPTKEMPAIDSPVMGRIAYHNRTGKHDVLAYDWDQFIAFADKYLKLKEN